MGCAPGVGWVFGVVGIGQAAVARWPQAHRVRLDGYGAADAGDLGLARGEIAGAEREILNAGVSGLVGLLEAVHERPALHRHGPPQPARRRPPQPVAAPGR